MNGNIRGLVNWTYKIMLKNQHCSNEEFFYEVLKIGMLKIAMPVNVTIKKILLTKFIIERKRLNIIIIIYYYQTVMLTAYWC